MKRLGKYRGIIYLGGLLIGVPLLIWVLAIGNTFSEWRDYRRVCKQIEVLQQEPVQATEVQGNNTLAFSEEGVVFRTVLAASAQSKATVERYTPFITRREGGFTVHTDEFILCGEYIPLVRLINRIEHEMGFGKIVSAQFRLIVPRARQQQKELKLTLLIQHISNP